MIMKKITISVSDEVVDRLSALSERSGLDLVQIIRRGIIAMDLITELEDEGSSIIVRHSDGQEEALDLTRLDDTR